MTGGMATVAGSVLAAYIGFLEEMTRFKEQKLQKSYIASVMAAPEQ